jgi:hypothetical protein
MKKYLVIALLILSIGLLLAVDSAPSATVGYFKNNSPINSWMPISIPFSDTDMSVDTIMGDQFLEGDAVADIGSGVSTTYNGDPYFVWDGGLLNFEYGRAYWITRMDDHPTIDYFIMGTVNPQECPITIDGNPNPEPGSYAWTPFALNEARTVPISSLPIIGVNDGDGIADIETGASTTYAGDPYFVWDGALTEIEPTHAYWYTRASATGFSWTYIPAERQNSSTPTFKTTTKK